MQSTKSLIVDAVCRFPVQETAAWRELNKGPATAEIDHIEARAASINTTDCLFDGEATIVLKDARALQAMIFGRFDGRRAEVERIVIAA
ncbi:hypothetical protein [Oryzibacter oryziterrae]|uniref:hypothetical protein n=1 Tax=Oryzibacter oryziterrae TaxID=2766474 RepID=UPI001F270A0A|nr:hypothetical protein [Oryzibacter oryziterrae]